MAEIRHLKDENTALTQKLSVMEERLNLLEQQDKEKNLIVAGIPKQPGGVEDSMKKVLTAMKMNLNVGDVQEIFRINNKDDAPILLKLKTTEIRSAILKKIRELKGMKLNECGLVGGAKNIFFNEDLTKHNQLLFKRAREVKKEQNYKSVFVANGKIYLKKEENSKPIRIKCEADLN